MCKGRQKSNTQIAKYFTIYSYDTGFQDQPPAPEIILVIEI